MNEVSNQTTLGADCSYVYNPLTVVTNYIFKSIKGINNSLSVPNNVNKEANTKYHEEDVKLNKILKVGEGIRKNAELLIHQEPSQKDVLSLNSKKGLMVSSLLLSCVQSRGCFTVKGLVGESQSLNRVKRNAHNYDDTITFNGGHQGIDMPQCPTSNFLLYPEGAEKKTSNYLDNLRMKSDHSSSGIGDYVDNILSKLGADSWPLDFKVLRNKFEKNILHTKKVISNLEFKIQENIKNRPRHSILLLGKNLSPYHKKARDAFWANKAEGVELNEKLSIENGNLKTIQERLDIINLLLHPDNSNLSTAWNHYFEQLDFLYSEKERLSNEHHEYKKHLKSLKDGAGAVIQRYINSEREEIKENISQVKICQHDLHKKIENFEKAVNTEVNQMESDQRIDIKGKIYDVVSGLDIPDLKIESSRIKNSEIIDKLILDKLIEKGISIYASDLEVKYCARFYQGNNFSGYISLSNSEEEFTLKQILLGEADRSVFIHIGGSQGISKIYNDKSTSNNIRLMELLNDKNTRLNIADAVMYDVNNLILRDLNNAEYIECFKNMAYGRIFYILSTASKELSTKSKIYHEIIDGFIAGYIQPSAVLFKGKVVPDLLSLGNGRHNLIFSLQENKLLITSCNKENPQLPRFIFNHLPGIEQAGFIVSDIQEIKFIDSRLNQKWDHRLTVTERNQNLQFKTVPEIDPYYAVFKSSIEKKLSNINGVIYTSHEKKAKIKNDIKRVFLDSADVLVMLATTGSSSSKVILSEFVGGASSKLGYIYLDMELIEKADRGIDLEQAKQNLMSSQIYLGLNLAKTPKVMAQITGKGLDLVEQIMEVSAKRISNLLIKNAKFRINRGGDSLVAKAARYQKFDQLDFPSKLKDLHPSGVCHGLSLEIIQRLEHSVDTERNLLTVINKLNEDLMSKTFIKKELLESIDRKQSNPRLFKTQNYHAQPTIRYHGEHQVILREIRNDIMELESGDVGLIRAYINGIDGVTLPHGHIIMVQRITQEQFELFDSNNGVFSYTKQMFFNEALENYFNNAYQDKGTLYPGGLTVFTIGNK